MNKVVLVTGGSRGIGRGICLELAKRGWFVGINFRGNQTAAGEVLKIIHEEGGTGFLLQGDISKSEDRTRMVTTLLDRYQRIDLLINNAGVAPRQRLDLLEIQENAYEFVMDINLKGTFFLTQLVANTMIDLVQKEVVVEPTIINIGSISAYTSSPNRGEYCLSKAGIGMMTALFADRLAEYGIGVFEIRPGVIETDMTGPVKDKYDHLISEGMTPIKRWGHPEDVAKAVAAIAEGFFPFSTGEVINVDGGFHLHRL
jgi:NAD(P)-dependent dehydrogenase (short-subunit alcohol dehydrogenase family)